MTPDSTTGDRRLDEALAEYRQLSENGTPPERDSFLARFPDLSNRLAEGIDRLNATLRGRAMADPEATLAYESATTAHFAARHFGDYELLNEIARGGMGVVYHAHQISLKRPVAIKMILAGQLASEAEVRRFRHEAESAANLDHPNILPIYEVGEHDGQHYFSMKLIEGGSLSALLPVLRDDPKRGIALLILVCRAVHFAHQRGLLHRDLKPANILIDRDGTPFVSDFGLAKRTDGSSMQTQSGAIVGTPSYMAPEQARAEKQLTTSIDVYSLGAILYELLAGRPPFRGSSIAETIIDVMTKEPEHPQTFRAQADADLSVIALKCLRKEASKRYESAGALAADLERWLRGEPIQARPATRSERAWKWVRRNPAISALASICILVLVGGAVVSAFFGVAASRERDRAREQARIADDQRKSADSNALNAQIKEQESRHRLVRSHVANGNRLFEVGDSTAALLWYIEALKLVAGDPEQEAMHRRRIGMLLRNCPRQTGCWRLPEGSRSAALNYDKLASLDDKGSLQVWNATTGQPIGPAIHHDRPIQFARFDRSGTAIIAAADNADCRMWDFTSGQAKGTTPNDYVIESFLDFHPDGKRCLLLGKKKDDKSAARLLYWETATGSISSLGVKIEGSVSSAVFNPAGNVILLDEWLDIGSPRGETRITAIDTATGAVIAKILQSMTGNLNEIAIFDASGENVLINQYDIVLSRNLKQADNVGIGVYSYSDINGLTLSPDRTRLALTGREGVMVWSNGAQIWGSPTGQECRRPLFSPDSLRIAAWTDRSALRIWGGGQHIEASPYSDFPILHHPNEVAHQSFTKDSRSLITVDVRGFVRTWDLGLPGGQPLLEAFGEKVAVAESGRRAAVYQTGSLRIWDLMTAKEIGAPIKFPDLIQSVRFSSDGSRLLISDQYGRISLWNADTATRIPLEGIPDKCISFFSGDSQRLVVQGNQKDAYQTTVYETMDGRKVGSWLVSPKEGYQMQFSRTARYCLRESLLWDVENAKAIALENMEASGDPTQFNQRAVLHLSRLFAFSANKDRLFAWENASGRQLWQTALSGKLLDEPSREQALQPNAQGSRLLVGMVRRTLLLDADNGTTLAEFPYELTSQIRFTPDGTRVVIRDELQGFRLLSAENGKPVTPWMARNRPKYVWPQFSPGGRTMLVGNSLWDAGTGDPVFVPDGNSERKSAPNFLDEDKLLTLHSDTNGICADPLLHREIFQYYPPATRLLAVDISADNRPIEELQCRAEMLASRRIDDGAAIVVLSAGEILERFAVQAPPTISRDERIAWHQSEAELSHSPFHVDMLLDLDPKRAEWHFHSAALLMAAGKFDEAQKRLATAADLGLDRSDLWVARGWCYSSVDFGKAEDAFSKALERSPGRAETWYARASIRMEQARYAEAVADLEEARRRKIDDSRLWESQLDTARIAAGRLDAFRQDCTKMIERLARQPYDLDRPEAAWRCCRIPNGVSNYDLLRAWSSKNYQSGRYGSAGILGAVLVRSGNQKEAIPLLEKSLKEHANVPRSLAMIRCFLAMALHQTGKTQEAKEQLDLVEKWLGDEGARQLWPERFEVQLLLTETQTVLKMEPAKR